MLQRNGKRYEYNGETTIPSGAEIRISTAKDKLALHLREMDKGSWAIFELPGFTSAAVGMPQDSLDALRAAKTTSYFKDKERLWVKLVVEGRYSQRRSVVVQVGHPACPGLRGRQQAGLGSLQRRDEEGARCKPGSLPVDDPAPESGATGVPAAAGLNLPLQLIYEGGIR